MYCDAMQSASTTIQSQSSSVEVANSRTAKAAMSREEGARFSPQPTRNKSCCSVNGCHSRACRDLTVRFHSFPKPAADFVRIPNRSGALERMTRRDAWARRLMIDRITENTRICSLHFKRSDYILPDAPTQKRYLKRDAVPSCNLPLSRNRSVLRTGVTSETREDAMKQRLGTGMTSEASKVKIRKCLGNTAMSYSYAMVNNGNTDIQLKTRIKNDQPQSDNRCAKSRWNLKIKEEPMDPEIKLEPENEETDDLCNYVADQESITNGNTNSADSPMKRETEEIEIKLEAVDLPDVDLNVPHFRDPASNFRCNSSRKSSTFRDSATQMKDQLRGPKFSDIIKTSRDLNVLTGIPNFSVLGTVVDVAKIASPRLARARGLRLDVEDRVIMTFMKLKQDLTYGALSAFFGCKSRRSCKRIILRTLETLGCCLRFAIRWPGKNETPAKLPDFPGDLPDVRCVISRIEVAVKTPKEVVKRVMTFSSCKRRHSAKFMTVVTPAGFVCFLSRAYGGRTPHRTIFEDSNVVELLERNDALMVLKDFPIEDICRKRDITLVKSLYSRDSGEARDSPGYRLRLNVNRRIRRFAVFRRKLSNALAPRAEEILAIICAVENLASLTSGVANSGRS